MTGPSLAERQPTKAAAEAHKELAKEAGQTVKEIAGQVDSTPTERPQTSVTTIVQAAAKPEAVAAEAEKGYGLMIIGLEKTVARGHEFHDDVAALAAGSPRATGKRISTSVSSSGWTRSRPWIS